MKAEMTVGEGSDVFLVCEQNFVHKWKDDLVGHGVGRPNGMHVGMFVYRDVCVYGCV